MRCLRFQSASGEAPALGGVQTGSSGVAGSVVGGRSASEAAGAAWGSMGREGGSAKAVGMDKGVRWSVARHRRDGLGRARRPGKLEG